MKIQIELHSGNPTASWELPDAKRGWVSRADHHDIPKTNDDQWQ